MKKRMSKKGAMELSINTIVIVVIGITLLVLGLTFVRTIFTRMGGTTEKAFAGADTILEEMTGTEQRLNVQTAITVKRGATQKIPIKLCNIEGDGDSLKLKIISTNLANSGVTINIPEIAGLETLTTDTTGKTASSAQSLDAGNCVIYQMFVSAVPSAPVTVGAGPLLTFKAVKTDNSEYGSTGSIISVEK